MSWLLSFQGSSGGGGGGSNSFATFQPDFGTSPTATVPADTAIFTSSDGFVTITGNAGTKTLDFTAGALLSSFTPGSVLFAGADGSISEDNATFFRDLSTGFFGVDTNTPDAWITVHTPGIEGHTVSSPGPESASAVGTGGGFFNTNDQVQYRVYGKLVNSAITYYSNTYAETNTVTTTGGQSVDITWDAITSPDLVSYVLVRRYQLHDTIQEEFNEMYDTESTGTSINDTLSNLDFGEFSSLEPTEAVIDGDETDVHRVGYVDQVDGLIYGFHTTSRGYFAGFLGGGVHPTFPLHIEYFGADAGEDLAAQNFIATIINTNDTNFGGQNKLAGLLIDTQNGYGDNLYEQSSTIAMRNSGGNLQTALVFSGAGGFIVGGVRCDPGNLNWHATSQHRFYTSLSSAYPMLTLSTQGVCAPSDFPGQTASAGLYVGVNPECPNDGSAGTGPFKMMPRTLLDTPEAYLFETDGTDIFWTDGSGTRRTITIT